MTQLCISTPENHISAEEFVENVRGKDFFEREKIAEEVLLNGNVPSWMRTFVDVKFTVPGFVANSVVQREVVIKVLPDYLTIGTDESHLRYPLSPLASQRIADAWNCLLPTTKLVTLVWHAGAKVTPRPWGPPYDASMHSLDRFVAHNKLVDDDLAKHDILPGMFVVGHKKDVVITNRLVSRPKQVAIFGWHQPNGKAIQPLSLIHENTYADYSHGTRLISQICTIDGIEFKLDELLCDKTWGKQFSDEGPMKTVRQPGV
jgi:hypothetical protein